MKKSFFITLLMIMLLSSCGESVTPAPEPTNTRTIRPTYTPSPTKTQIPTPILTPTAAPDAQGNITWHPQQVLMLLERGGGDGATFHASPKFMLLWDGTLLQPAEDIRAAPFVSHLDQTEVCKLLNTVEKSGFFEEQRHYSFPFAGAPGEWLTVNSWRSNSSGAQALSSALSSVVYYDPIFCRDCPIPDEETIIKPGLANAYFLLENYSAADRTPLAWDKLLVYLYPGEEGSSRSWPLTSIAVDELIKKCVENFCDEAGMVVDGEVAREIASKVDGSEYFSGKLFQATNSFRIRYRVLWPYEPTVVMSYPEPQPWHEMPDDYTLTCNASAGVYPLLPLDPENKFWSYSPTRQVAAEVVNATGSVAQIRLVDKLGNERFQNYQAASFGPFSSVQVFPRFWTEDGSYFFVNIVPPNYDYMVQPFVNSIGLQRISPINGQADYLFKSENGNGFAHDISEAQRKAVYIEQGKFPLKIAIKDLYSLEEESATLITPDGADITYTDAGTITLSPDERFIYVAANYGEDGAHFGVLIKISISNPLIQSVIHQGDFAFKLVRIAYYDRDAGLCPLTSDFEAYCRLRLDLESGSVGDE